MVVLEQADYERVADEVVSDYFAGTPLNDSVYKRASDMGLNPAQVRQLVWQANTKTHLQLFEKKAEDKMVEFPVCDADYILKRMYAPAEEQPLPMVSSEKVAMDFYSPLETVTEKVAEETWRVEAVQVSDATATRRRERATRSMQKTASELEQQVLIERELYMDKLYKLAFELRKIDRDEFEKDAYAMLGDAVVPLLNDLRGVYKHDATGSEKLASTYERVVDTNTKHYRELGALKGHYDNAIKYAHSLVWLKSQVAAK
jgi:hypothetical protein